MTTTPSGTQFTRGAVTVTKDQWDMLHLSLGTDLANPETEVFGAIHIAYIDDLIAALTWAKQGK